MSEHTTIKFLFKGKPYTFFSEDNGAPLINKTFFIGSFHDEAPENCQIGVRYVLRSVRSQNPFTLQCPGCRSIFDLVSFKGDHICPILCLDDAATRIVHTLETSPTSLEKETGMAIVPLGLRFSDLEQRGISPIEKLKIILQIAKGVQELLENKVSDSSVIAHRDIKMSNIIFFMDNATKEIRAKLIDFATIRLDGEGNKKGFSIRLGTTPATVSLENTCIEDIDPKTYPYSDKTDVYGLGSLLSEMFLVPNYSLSNQWFHTLKINWGAIQNATDIEKITPRIINAFNKVYDDYDSHYDPCGDDLGWLEKVQNDTIEWSQEFPPQIMSSIKKLFRRSCRINPQDRPNLEQFMVELQRIITATEATDSSTDDPIVPTDIYIFDRTDITRHKSCYFSAALDILRNGAENAKAHGTTPPGAVCVSYGRPEPRTPFIRYIEFLSPAMCLTQTDLRNAIASIPNDRNEKSVNILLHGINTAVNQIHRLRGKLSFTGNIHVFTPRPPKEEELTPVGERFLNECCAGWEKHSMKPITITLHSPIDEEDGWWTNLIKTAPPQSESEPIQDSNRVRHMDKPPSKEKKNKEPSHFDYKNRSGNTSLQEEEYSPNDTPSKKDPPVKKPAPSVGRLFIMTPDGVKHYIGIDDNQT